ncbi:MAG: hypothetical protein ACREE7_10005, partial [Dongiaceae bacterium]
MRTFWLLCASLALAQAPSKNPFAGDPGAIDNGRGIFRIFCSPCHGIKADGGRGPDLTLGTYSIGDSDAALFNIIMD